MTRSQSYVILAEVNHKINSNTLNKL